MIHRRSIPAAAPLTSEERAFRPHALIVLAQHDRPRTRSECIDGPRPCPFVSCEFHLYAQVTPDGSLELNFPSIPPTRMDLLPHGTCALDLADGGATAEEAADAIGMTRGRVVQLVAQVRPALSARLGRVAAK